MWWELCCAVSRNCYPFAFSAKVKWAVAVLKIAAIHSTWLHPASHRSNLVLWRAHTRRGERFQVTAQEGGALLRCQRGRMAQRSSRFSIHTWQPWILNSKIHHHDTATFLTFFFYYSSKRALKFNEMCLQILFPCITLKSHNGAECHFVWTKNHIAFLLKAIWNDVFYGLPLGDCKWLFLR